MICNQCGTLIPDNVAVCPRCGCMTTPASNQPTVDSTPIPPQPPVQPSQPAYPVYTPPQATDPQRIEMERESLANSILTFGILAVALDSIPILALIFGIIARKKAKQYQQTYGVLPTKAVVGNILGLVGLIMNIVVCVSYALLILVYAGMFAMIGLSDLCAFLIV